MTKLDPVVRKETVYAAAWTAALSLVMEAVFLLLKAWDLSVLGGNLAGALTAVINYLLLGVTVSRALATGQKDRVALRVHASKSLRLLGMAAVCAVCIGLLHTNVYATLIPLIFPRIGLAFRPMIDRKRGAGRAEPEGSDVLD